MQTVYPKQLIISTEPTPRRWNTMTRELRHIVEHTPSKDWEQTLKRFYKEFVGSGNHDIKEEEEDKDLEAQNKGKLPQTTKTSIEYRLIRQSPTLILVFMSLERQRQHLEHSLDTYKKSLASAEWRRKVEKDKAVTQNTKFIQYEQQCNYI